MNDLIEMIRVWVREGKIEIVPLADGEISINLGIYVQSDGSIGDSPDPDYNKDPKKRW